jgi:glyceraldehyde-3-phosphate dehydrogenase/erythrose-4-phosphate dehydrogenase
MMRAEAAMDTALVISWKVPFPGREKQALELAALTIALGTLVKVFGRYDSEFGYACRLVDLIGVVGHTG